MGTLPQGEPQLRMVIGRGKAALCAGANVDKFRKVFAGQANPPVEH